MQILNRVDFENHPSGYAYRYYFVPASPDEQIKLWDWCCETFGRPGGLWDGYATVVDFKTSKEALLFELTWDK